MSGSAEATAYFDALADLVEYYRFGMAMPALIAYEYLITLDQEVALFWKRKKTGASWLFFATRYLALLAYAIISPPSSSFLPGDSCPKMLQVSWYTQMLQYPLWAAFAALRTLALSGMNGWLATLVFILSCGPFIVDAWAGSYGISGQNVFPVGCYGGVQYAPTKAVVLLTIVLPRSANIIGDMIVCGVTWWYTTKNDGMRAIKGTLPPLARVLVVNGTIYFLVIVLLNLVQLALTVIPYFHPLPHAEIILFTDPLTAILICRFMLALQSANQRAVAGRAFDSSSTHAEHEDDTDARHAGTLQFATAVLGSMGATLAPGAETSLFMSDDGYDDESDSDEGYGGSGSEVIEEKRVAEASEGDETPGERPLAGNGSGEVSLIAA